MNWGSIRNVRLKGIAVTLLLLTVAGCWSAATVKPELDGVKFVGAAVAYAWVQLGEQGSASARAIIASPGATCPEIKVNNAAAVSMKSRNIPSSYEGFKAAVTVCEFSLALPVTQVSIDNAGTSIELTAVTGASDKILVLGDTGCRLKGSFDQRCKGGTLDQGLWGFPALSVSAASEPTPDLMLHVGDYLYRESTATDNKTCDPYAPSYGWVNCGDNWAAWEDDFFAPANIKNALGNSLLNQAPWIFVRGNHEDCSRAWQGYFLFFYPQAAPSACDDVIDPYPVKLSGLDVYVVDTANESPSSAQVSFATVYQDLANSNKATWLSTHVPMSYLSPAYDDSKLFQRKQLKWIHVGHIHRFQHSIASSTLQAETVTGGSGTALDSCSDASICSATSSADCCYGQISSTDAGQYSYMTVVAQGGGWVATLHDVNGKALHKFRVH